MKTRISIFLSLLFFSSAWAQLTNEIVVDVDNHVEKVFTQENLIIFNHNSSRWDANGSSRNGMNNVLRFYHERRTDFESFMVVDREGVSSDFFNPKYYLESNDVDNTVASPDGSHLLRFPNARKIIFSGGDFSMCLCEAMRDSIRGVTINDDDLSIYLVMDAIYAETFFFNRYLNDDVMAKKRLNLSEMFNHLDEEQIKSFLRMQIIRDESMMCPLQSRSPEGPLDLSPYEFIFKVNEAEVLSIGSGEKKVIISFINSKDLEIL